MGWLSHKWSWAKRNPLFWVNLLLIAISSLILFAYPGPSDLRLRSWGLTLELLGIVTVWHDLTSTARKYEKGSFMKNTWQWVKAFKRSDITLQASCTLMGSGGLKARLKVRKPLNSASPLPDRVAALEGNFEKLDSDLDAAFREIETSTTDLEGRITSVKTESDRAINEVKANLIDAATGNFTALAFGAFWLAVGAMFATWATEILRIAGGGWHDVWRAF